MAARGGELMPAPQEFRDGCAYAAQTIIERVKQAKRFGLPITVENVEYIATEFAHEMGGYVDARTMKLLEQD
jgi:hypothetical protein